MLGRILVVDDDGMNRELMTRRLSKRGYETIAAASAYEALAILSDQEVDLVILDVMMPGMNGMEMLVVIRQTYSSSQLPVIMATGMADSEDVVEALNRGANDYIVKPLDMAVCIARIERLLRERKATVALEKMNKDLLSNQSSSSFGDTTANRSFQATGVSGGGETITSQKPERILVGKTVGKYEIQKAIGIGGAAQVYLAYDPLIEREVAIKVLSSKHSENNERTQRFLTEAKTTGRLDHPNIISVYDVNKHGDALYIVMEYAEGGSLKRRIDQQGPFSLEVAARCVIEAASGLRAAHEKSVVHRDVKPDNLLMTSDEQVKVTDFGIAKFQAGDSRDLELTQEGKRIGTPLYMSPEQITMTDVDRRTDIYGLGASFYFLLTGKPPFAGKTVAEVTSSHLKDDRPDPCKVNPELPVECSQIIAKAMAVEPDQRYQSMTEFIQAVESIPKSSPSPRS